MVSIRSRSSKSNKFRRMILNIKILQSVLFLLVIHFISFAQATWWLLGTDFTNHLMNDMVPGTSFNHCHTFQHFTDRQQNMCQKSGKVFSTISAGAKLGIEECQFQLQSHRWNCSVIREADNVFGKVLEIQSREKAYVHALYSASLAYEITKNCAKGNLEDCSCDEKVRTRPTKGKFQWGGCSEDVNYGALFSQEFADSNEDLASSEGSVNLHNNEVGRKLLKQSMNMSCKCHGVSGSCTMKVCWRVLNTFRDVGVKIREKFEGAFRVKAVRRSINKNGKLTKFRLKPMSKDQKKAGNRDLVYIEESPTYCEQNDTLHVLGTKGRICNQTSDGPDGCRLLCCGRGYQTMVREGVEKCNCQFVWCCRVECESCAYKRDEHICN